MSVFRQFLTRVRTTGQRRSDVVKTVAMGRERTFDAYDVGADTFIFERGVSSHLLEHPSALLVPKRCLNGQHVRGVVFTLTTGNHAVAALPLLDGRFWRLSRVPPAERSATLLNEILCANVVEDALELSQRELTIERLVAGDTWLLGVAGFSLADILFADRNEAVLDHYRRVGQEWRVKPLAWTQAEMRLALDAAKKRISTVLTYYHSVRGVHFLSFAEFDRFARLAQTAPEKFVSGLRELVGVFEGNAASFCRQSKHRGHHEIEFFGLKRGTALETLVPELEKLLEDIVLKRTGRLGIIQKAQEISSLYRSLLAQPELAEEENVVFTSTLYMYVTGEVYAVVGEGSTPAFDDRRTALPGATFVNGRLTMHPGADARSEVLLANLCEMLSKDEYVEYANVYELRDAEDVPLGKGRTREIVYKTNLRPLEASLVEKGLASRRHGYSEYMLARIGGLRALGVHLSDYYRLLRRRATSGHVTDFYIRLRCEGEPMESIPASAFRGSEGSAGEDPEVVCALAALMGDAAAQTMAMKKFESQTESPLYGVGKEIYEFGYDVTRGRTLPRRVSICSIRGSLGWPDLEESDLNMRALSGFYLTHFAHALKLFQVRHAVPMKTLAEHFMSGFAFRTNEMAWHASVMRDQFDKFAPPIPASYNFARKWHFVLWSLDRQARRLASIRKMFFEKTRVLES